MTVDQRYNPRSYTNVPYSIEGPAVDQGRANPNPGIKRYTVSVVPARKNDDGWYEKIGRTYT